MKILHIIRNPNDATPFEIAKAQSKKHEVMVILMHDAVYAKPGMSAFAVEADAKARGVTQHELAGYDMIVKMLFEYDKVVSW